jgi:hypothetical protein
MTLEGFRQIENSVIASIVMLRQDSGGTAFWRRDANCGNVITQTRSGIVANFSVFTSGRGRRKPPWGSADAPLLGIEQPPIAKTEPTHSLEDGVMQSELGQILPRDWSPGRAIAFITIELGRDLPGFMSLRSAGSPRRVCSVSHRYIMNWVHFWKEKSIASAGRDYRTSDDAFYFRRS